MALILVVDDDTALKMLYEQELLDDGHEVLLAGNGKEALEILETQRPDLMIVDISMPGMDGIDLMWHVMQKYRTLPVILNTAYSNYKDNYLTWPATRYVLKSGDLTALKCAIGEVIDLVHA
jgi:CheY-like chemotaxis protein